VLGGSGHIAGIVNPPAAKKSHHSTNQETPQTPELWLENAKQHAGSWWDYWQAWMQRQNGEERVQARVPGGRELRVIEDEPGSYAMLRSALSLRDKSLTRNVGANVAILVQKGWSGGDRGTGFVSHGREDGCSVLGPIASSSTMIDSTDRVPMWPARVRTLRCSATTW
jgi:hypothetical protein